MNLDLSRLNIITELHGLTFRYADGNFFIDSDKLSSKEIYESIIRIMEGIGSVNRKGYVNDVNLWTVPIISQFLHFIGLRIRKAKGERLA